MRALLHVFQTIGLSIAFVFLLKTSSVLRSFFLKKALKVREKNNEKRGFPKEYGIEEIDENSLSYQMDSIEGGVASICLFFLGGLLTLFVPISEAEFFSIVAFIISSAEILYCWLTCRTATKKYCILLYVSSGISSLLFVYALFCLFADFGLLINYSNSINTILFICSTMTMYKLILNRKPNK